VAGQLSGYGDGDDRAPLAASFECFPACVQTAAAHLGTGADGSGLSLPAPLERDARA